jgi:hypothetical protein
MIARVKKKTRVSPYEYLGMSLRIRRKWLCARLNMLNRLTDPSNREYKRYGARGIRVCKSWREGPRRFLEWIVTQPGHDDESMTLDRKDNDGHYCPKNCRLVPQSVQNRNHRRNVKVSYKGEEMIATEFWERFCKSICQNQVLAYFREGLTPSQVVEKDRQSQLRRIHRDRSR